MPKSLSFKLNMWKKSLFSRLNKTSDFRAKTLAYNISQIKSDECFKDEGEDAYRLVHDRTRDLQKHEVSFKNAGCYNLKMGNMPLFSRLNKTSDFRAKMKECTNKYMTESAPREIAKYHLKMGNSGFSLVETAVVLTISSVAAVLFYQIVTYKLSENRYEETENKMKEVMVAIERYVAENAALPCPADPNLAITDNNFGFENRSSGASRPCLSPSPVWYTTGGFTNRIVGSIPTKALHLPDTYAFDNWERKLTYVIVTECTRGSQTNLPTLLGPADATIANPVYDAANNFTSFCARTGMTNPGFTILNGSSGATIGTRVPYVLISHGENGHGAYGAGSSSTRYIASFGLSNDELNNAQMTAGGADSTNSGTFYSKELVLKRDSTYFDDIVMFQHKNEIIDNIKAYDIYSANTNIANNCALFDTINSTSTAICTGMPGGSDCTNIMTKLSTQLSRLCY